MNKVQLKKFKTLLTEKRDEIVKKAKQTLEEDMTLDANDLPDEMDLASSEYLQSFTFRLRGREKVFLDKIEKALRKIEEGTFGTCEECQVRSLDRDSERTEGRDERAGDDEGRRAARAHAGSLRPNEAAADVPRRARRRRPRHHG